MKNAKPSARMAETNGLPTTTVADGWRVVRCLPPHPNPLPQGGEGTALGVILAFVNLNWRAEDNRGFAEVTGAVLPVQRCGLFSF